jgi:hypothetical protein
MSPRRNHPKRRGPKPDNEEREFSTSSQSIEEHAEGDYYVRKITGSSSTKPYRCPGCDQLIPTATPHIVAWPVEDIELRRHWHTACWAKKDHRRPRTERSRNAPRY